MTRETVLGFADEMRVGLRGTVRRVWGRRGVKVRQRVQTMYEWMYLFCVVDGRRGRLLWSWIDSMKADRIAAAVNGLKRGTEVEASAAADGMVHEDTAADWWRWWDCLRWYSRRTVLNSIPLSECSRKCVDGLRAGSTGVSRRRSRQ